jgi:hypothetical protein
VKLLPLFAGIALLCSGQRVDDPLRAEDVILRIGVENPVAPVGTPVYLAMLAKNISQRGGITFKLAGVGFDVIVKDEQGSVVPRPEWYRDPAQLPFSGDPWRELQAGSVSTQQIDLTRFFDLRKPGKYTVSASGLTNVGGAPPALSNAAEFEVVTVDSKARPEPIAAIRTLAAMYPDLYPPMVTLRVFPERIRVTRHEPVFGEMRFYGIRGLTLRDFGDGSVPYRASVRYPDGTRTEVFEPKPEVRTGLKRPLVIQAGEGKSDRVLLNRWVDFEQEGEYDIAMYLPESASPMQFIANVGPRNEEVLDAAVKKLVAATSVDQDLSYTALALMYEEVALRELEKLGGELAIAALLLMETPESINAVAGMIAKLGEKNAAFYRERLRILGSRTKDRAVRQAIQGVLAAQ